MQRKQNSVYVYIYGNKLVRILKIRKGGRYGWRIESKQEHKSRSLENEKLIYRNKLKTASTNTKIYFLVQRTLPKSPSSVRALKSVASKKRRTPTTIWLKDSLKIFKFFSEELRIDDDSTNRSFGGRRSSFNRHSPRREYRRRCWKYIGIGKSQILY